VRLAEVDNPVGELFVDLRALGGRPWLNAQIGRFHVPVGERGLSLAVEHASAVPERIVSDGARLGPILVNLIGNAIKFTERGGVDLVVRLETAGAGARLVFEVIDPGPLDGVALVGGADGRASAAGSNPAGRAEVPRGRVLLAEDSPDNQRLVRAILQRAGHHVEVVGDGECAVAAALAARDADAAFDVVLMDMQMPVLDGYGATRRLRASGYAGVIVALTAHAMQGDREKCLNAGCDDFATKPIARAELVDVIARHLRKPGAPGNG
jgi:CheY-like chemotaxis protein